MPKSGNWRHTLRLKRNELAMHHFIIDDDRLEVSQFILEFTGMTLTAKEVDTVENCIALNLKLKYYF